MKANNYIVVIPARYESTRLPGKPLVEICGLPMIVRTYNQCIKAVSEEVTYVATDDERIVSVCEEYGMKYLMTSSDCKTGTDRVAEVTKIIDADYYINVQGDEPVFNPEDIVKLVDAISMHPGTILNGFCKIKSGKQYFSRSIPKVVKTPNGQLLYMSRAAIPSSKQEEFNPSHRQVCAYAFPKKALQLFTSSKGKTPLEEIEDIEILRFLELGLEVQMIEMSDMSVAVDTPEDVVLAEAKIKELCLV